MAINMTSWLAVSSKEKIYGDSLSVFLAYLNCGSFLVNATFVRIYLDFEMMNNFPTILFRIYLHFVLVKNFPRFFVVQIEVLRISNELVVCIPLL
jgi:hypothetical protein